MQHDVMNGYKPQQCDHNLQTAEHRCCKIDTSSPRKEDIRIFNNALQTTRSFNTQTYGSYARHFDLLAWKYRYFQEILLLSIYGMGQHFAPLKWITVPSYFDQMILTDI